MIRSDRFVLAMAFVVTFPAWTVQAQQFGRDAESSRLTRTGDALVKEEERIGKYKAWLQEQNSGLQRRQATYQRDLASLNRAVNQWRCPNGYSLAGCFARPPACRQTWDFRARVLTASERLDRERSAINVQRQRLNTFNQSLTSQVADYNQRLARYKADWQDFSRRYSDEKGLTFDESEPKARPR
jgi:hypothetical protein